MAISVEEIKEAIFKLDPSELAKFRAWFWQFDATSWDQQIERDASEGKLAELAEAALFEERTLIN